MLGLMKTMGLIMYAWRAAARARPDGLFIMSNYQTVISPGGGMLVVADADGDAESLSPVLGRCGKSEQKLREGGSLTRARSRSSEKAAHSPVLGAEAQRRRPMLMAMQSYTLGDRFRGRTFL
jgi:hypothetical protein